MKITVIRWDAADDRMSKVPVDAVADAKTVDKIAPPASIIAAPRWSSENMVVAQCHVRNEKGKAVTVLQYARQADYVDGVEIEVVNGSGVEKIGQEMIDYLKGKGYTNVDGVKEDAGACAVSVIYNPEDFLQSAARVAGFIPGNQEMEKMSDPLEGPRKIRVMIGRDMLSRAPFSLEG